MSTTAPVQRHSARRTGFEHLESRLLLSTTRASQAVNSFGADLYEQIQHEQGNLFFSPLSVTTALAMTYAGAAGQTAAEMERVLHLGAEPGIHESFAALLTSLTDQTAIDDGFVLEIANAIWPRIGFPIRDEFIHTIEADYDGASQSLDYSNLEQARQIINAWVEDKTHGKVEELIKMLDPAVVMVLTNSIYFQADWKTPFNPTFTSTEQFRRENGEFVDVPIMAGRMELPAYTRFDGFKVLEMPLEGGRTSMVFALSEDPVATPNVLTSELLVRINNWVESPRERWEIDVMLPKFSTAVATQLEDLLADMGMPSAFGLAADFSKMTPQQVFISQVRHKAFLEMDEEGAEATAATAVQLALCFVAGTLVLTPEGPKPIEQIKAGDYVLSRDQYDVSGEIEPKRVEVTSSGHGDLVSLHIGGQVLRATKDHPFYVNEKGWTAAGELRPGDLLATDVGKWLEVENVAASGERGPIHNFRVADHHTYFVTGKAAKFAVWTHNEYEPKFLARHAFHFMIRDNTTDTILFMGRIDDPTQAENDLAPSYVPPDVSALAGDYNLDGAVDAADYVLWRATLGNTVIASSGADGNGNGVIDQSDRQVWQSNFGTTSPAAAPPAAAVVRLDAPAEPVGTLDEVPTSAQTPGSETVPDVGNGIIASPAASDRTFGMFGLQLRPRDGGAATSSRVTVVSTHSASKVDLLLVLDRAFSDKDAIPLDADAHDAVFADADGPIDLTGLLAAAMAGL